VVPEANVLERWPDAFAPTWQVEIGRGYSSPVVSGGRVFVHSRREPVEVVTAVDLATGDRVWQREYRADFTENGLAPVGLKGPFATPLVAGDRLFTLGVSGVLSSWDVATGELLWRNDYASLTSTAELFGGTAASPVRVADRVIVQVGNDLDGGRVLALDPATGAEMWSWTGVGPGYASPILINVDGVRHLVTLTEDSIIGLDVANGSLLWTALFPDEWHENIMTPVWTGTHLIVSGPRQGTHAFRLSRAGDRWRAAEAWANTDVTMYMSSPVFAGGTLYGHSSRRRGQFFALDAATGTLEWASEGREGEHAAVLLARDNLILLTDEAELIVAKPDTTTFTVAARYRVADGATWAVPVLLRDGLLVRDATTLARLAAAR
jgi:outer membrane protein assembly factor BamB